ncbi:hypothetical protein HDV05_006550 [Chytridiales sp. JEL 0842]|nr:hypothetical protein HDV05_006550 [Chytridiales sp. JEL 0842]
MKRSVIKRRKRVVPGVGVMQQGAGLEPPQQQEQQGPVGAEGVQQQQQQTFPQQGKEGEEAASVLAGVAAGAGVTKKGKGSAAGKVKVPKLTKKQQQQLLLQQQQQDAALLAGGGAQMVNAQNVPSPAPSPVPASGVVAAPPPASVGPVPRAKGTVSPAPSTGSSGSTGSSQHVPVEEKTREDLLKEIAHLQSLLNSKASMLNNLPSAPHAASHLPAALPAPAPAPSEYHSPAHAHHPHPHSHAPLMTGSVEGQEEGKVVRLPSIRDLVGDLHPGGGSGSGVVSEGGGVAVEALMTLAGVSTRGV